MGLDIYLSRYEDFELAKKLESEHNEYSERIWAEAGEYSSLTEDQKEELRKKDEDYAISLGLDKHGSMEKGVENIEKFHPDYPDHYFRIGYFRSSYNDSGIERILRNLGLPTMCDIFDRKDEDYEFRPDWDASLIRCEGVIEQLKKKGAYRVRAVSGNMFSEPTIHSEKEALDIFMEELGKNGPDDGYSNKNGEFHTKEPLKVVGMIPGTTRILSERPCVYIVTESDNTWYIQALEIVRDTIKFVLESGKKEQHYLRWSG